MSAWTNGTYTKRGLSLLAKLTQGDSLRITRVVAGTGYVTPTALANQTAVSGIKQELSLKAASYPEPGVCKLPMYLTNKGLNTGYKARQIGVYANDPDEGEILYFISQSDTGTDVPSEATMPEYSATWTFYFRYGQASSVSINVDPSHTITEDMLNEVRVIAEKGISVPNKGAVLTIENTAYLPFANLKLFGKTTQNGTPTPDNPAELVIAGASGSVVVAVAGKNLCSVNDITFTQNKNITLDVVIPAGTFYLSYKAVSADTDAATCLVTFLNEAGSQVGHTYCKRGEYTTVPVTVSDNVKGINFYSSSGHSASANDEATFSDIMLSLSSGTEFEPYKDAQTLAVSTPNGLPGIPVPSGGNYTDADGQQWICDEIDFLKNIYIKRVETLLLDPSIGWTKGADDQQTANTTLFYGYPTGKCPGAENIICDRFETKNVLTSVNDFPGIFGSIANQLLYIRVNGVMSLEEFKSWIESNPTNIIYELKTPTYSRLPESVIAEFLSLVSNNPYTTITNDADANMEADCFLTQHESAITRIFGQIQYLVTTVYSELSQKIEDLTTT